MWKEGKKSIHTVPWLKISTDDFGNAGTTRRLQNAKKGNRKICLRMCVCVIVYLGRRRLQGLILNTDMGT